MAHELIAAMGVTPTGPLTILLGQTVDLTAAFILNGPPSGSPTASSYTVVWKRVGVPASIATVFPADPLTAYTRTIPSGELPVGDNYFEIAGYYQNNAGQPDSFGFTYSAPVTVHVVREAREIEAELPDRTLTAGLPDRTVEGELPGRDVVAGLPSREVEGELPNRSVEAGLP